MNTPKKGSGKQDGIYLSTSTSPPNPGLLAKGEAEALRQSLSTFTSVMGVTNCGTKFLTTKVTATGREVIEVTDRCRNKHVCPNCMGYAYWKHAKALEALLPSWLDSGGCVYTQTLTLPNRNKPLIYKHIDLAETWKSMGKSKRFSTLRKRYGMVQYIRVLEDVLRVKGSFPRFHLTWFFQVALSNQEMSNFSQEISELWADSALKAGIRGGCSPQDSGRDQSVSRQKLMPDTFSSTDTLTLVLNPMHPRILRWDSSPWSSSGH